MKANIVSIILKDSNFISNSRQKKIEYTNYYEIISKNVIELLRDNYINGIAIRYVCVGVSGLKKEDDDEQIDMFSILNENKIKNLENVKKEKVTKTMDKL